VDVAEEKAPEGVLLQGRILVDDTVDNVSPDKVVSMATSAPQGLTGTSP